MKTGLFGGTFSPPHNGHIRAAKLFIKAAGLDRLIVMPAGIPPHKTADTDADSRLSMARLAFSDFAFVSDFEIKKEGKSYTVETLKWLRETYPTDELFMLVGEDMFLSLDTWRDPDGIVSLATVAYMRRSHGGAAALEEKRRRYEERWGSRFIYIGEDPTVVSSTKIREMVAAGEDIKGLTGDGVSRYIKENGLYI